MPSTDTASQSRRFQCLRKKSRRPKVIRQQNAVLFVVQHSSMGCGTCSLQWSSVEHQPATMLNSAAIGFQKRHGSAPYIGKISARQYKALWDSAHSELPNYGQKPSELSAVGGAAWCENYVSFFIIPRLGLSCSRLDAWGIFLCWVSEGSVQQLDSCCMLCVLRQKTLEQAVWLQCSLSVWTA